MNFTNIKENVYDVHLLEYKGFLVDTSNARPILRFYESGVLETASVYQFARQFGSVGGTFGESRSTTDPYINIVSGTTAATLTTGYCYFYNLTDSSKYSFNTAHNFTDLGSHFMMFESGVLPQTSAVDGIRISANTNFTDTFSGTISLYGIKES